MITYLKKVATKYPEEIMVRTKSPSEEHLFKVREDYTI